MPEAAAKTPPCPVMPADPLPGFEEGLVQEIAFDLYDAVGTRNRLPPEQTEARNAAAFVMLNSLAPADPLQAMLASQAVALHYAAMACFRRANETETAPDAQAPRLHHTAVRLITAFAATIQRLQTLQENSMHREPPPAPGPKPRKDPMQREKDLMQRETAPPPAAPPPGGAPPVAPAQAGAQGPSPGQTEHEHPPSDVASLGPRLREDDEGAPPGPAKHPMQRETASAGEPMVGSDPTHGEKDLMQREARRGAGTGPRQDEAWVSGASMAASQKGTEPQEASDNAGEGEKAGGKASDSAGEGKKEILPLPLREGAGGGVDGSPLGGVSTPPPNPLPQGEGESVPHPTESVPHPTSATLPTPKHPVHREPPKPKAPPAPEPYFDWRNKTVLERFAHFFPERLAAHNGDAAAAHAAWAAENEAEWARVRAARANAGKPHAT